MKRTKRKQKNSTGTCPCQICNVPEYLEEHHINGRTVPNYTASWNLVDVCANCHSKIHRNDIIIEGWKITSSGRTLFWHKKGEESFTGDDSSPYIISDGGSQRTRNADLAAPTR